jgi:hypothetical protein
MGKSVALEFLKQLLSKNTGSFILENSGPSVSRYIYYDRLTKLNSIN